MLISSTAAAELRIHWDCYLPSSGLNCATLQSSLTSKVPFIHVVGDASTSDVVVTLASLPAEGGTRLKLDFVGKPLDGYRTEVHSTDKIPSSVDSATATVRVLTKLERGLDDFMDQKVAAEARDGKLAIEVGDPVALPFTGRKEQSALRWYVAPSLGVYFSDVEGVGVNASGSASIAINYSGARWRLQQSIGASYLRQSQPVPGANETASIEFEGASATNVVAFGLSASNRWSLGLLLSAEKNPQANYTFRANGSLGIEFDLVPRQTVNQTNFGFRCAAGGELQRYDANNVEGRSRQTVARQFCDVFVGWHFDAIDLLGGLSETSILEDFTYRSFSASASVTWRVTDSLLVSPWVNLQQINQAIDEARPTTMVFTDPRQELEASMLAAVQQGYTAPFGVQTGISIRYVFGNGSLTSEDQRWKGTSNLR
jgi:hypothetical protein